MIAESQDDEAESAPSGPGCQHQRCGYSGQFRRPGWSEAGEETGGTQTQICQGGRGRSRSVSPIIHKTSLTTNYSAGTCLLGLTGVKVSAKERGNELDIEKEDKIRQFHPIDSLFDYFSSFQLVDSKGKKTTLMSGRNFYNAMTPGSSIGHAFGRGKGSYMAITEEDVNADWMSSQNAIPGSPTGLLNEINKRGLLTYTDFNFLFLLMSTPRRYVDMIFHAFDVSADGNVEAKEFIYILAKIANVKTDPEELLTSKKSGLVKYLFGDDLSGELTVDTFKDLQTRLIDDVLSLEFTR